LVWIIIILIHTNMLRLVSGCRNFSSDSQPKQPRDISHSTVAGEISDAAVLVEAKEIGVIDLLRSSFSMGSFHRQSPIDLFKITPEGSPRHFNRAIRRHLHVSRLCLLSEGKAVRPPGEDIPICDARVALELDQLITPGL